MARDVFGNDLDVGDFIAHGKCDGDDDTLNFGIVSRLDPPQVMVLNNPSKDSWWLGGKITIKDLSKAIRIPDVIINSTTLEDILRQQKNEPAND